jgi:hypothetical protein
MSRFQQPPLVTGISPNEGIPWTKVTIRGENLGIGPIDLIGKGQHYCTGANGVLSWLLKQEACFLSSEGDRKTSL